jgi:hypothetical protein
MLERQVSGEIKFPNRIMSPLNSARFAARLNSRPAAVGCLSTIARVEATAPPVAGGTRTLLVAKIPHAGVGRRGLDCEEEQQPPGDYVGTW